MTMINYKEFSKLNEGERSLVEWQYGFGGMFNTRLWEVICTADEDNLKLLAKGFPKHVETYYNYARKNGWWQELEKRLEDPVVELTLVKK